MPVCVTPNVGTTPIVFSSTAASIRSGSRKSRPCSIGISRISTSQYTPNLCQHTCTGPHTRFGFSIDLFCARIFARQRHFIAMPPSMHASLEPIVFVPVAPSGDFGAFQRSAIMLTQRRSIAADCGYSSLSIQFLLIERSISLWTY